MKDDILLNVSEVFYSIQGESSHSGHPCFFVRLAGCNLRCTYCDARYTYEEPGNRVPVSGLLEKTGQYPNALVEITGGEPLLQEAVYPLMDRLLSSGRTVLLETNGSVRIDRVPAAVTKIVDIKCPDSAMHDRMDFANLDLLAPHDELKFVLSSRHDYDWAVEILRKYQVVDRVKIFFSPVASQLPSADLARWILEDELAVRLQLQLHTILWPDRQRGV